MMRHTCWEELEEWLRGQVQRLIQVKRLIPVASGVYLPLAVRRYVMMTMGGFWPAMRKLPDGTGFGVQGSGLRVEGWGAMRLRLAYRRLVL